MNDKSESTYSLIEDKNWKQHNLTNTKVDKEKTSIIEENIEHNKKMRY